MRLFWTICVLFILSAPVFAGKAEPVSFFSEDGSLITGYMMVPSGSGPFPAVVALHGCGGPLNRKKTRLSSRHRDWGKRLVKWGYVALFPDSFGSRGYGSLCRVKKRKVKHRHRMRDAQGALKWLQKQRFIDGDSVSVLGWSNGGSTVLRLAFSKRGKGFRKAISFYPGCRSLSKRKKKKMRVPLHILMGREDDWTPPEPCEVLVKKRGGELILYDGAHHGFDTPNRPLKMRRGMAYSKNGDGIVHSGTHEPSRQRAIKDVRRILER